LATELQVLAERLRKFSAKLTSSLASDAMLLCDPGCGGAFTGQMIWRDTKDEDIAS
jgi:hypothetical protein